MKTIEIYDKPMCCSTGVCGPEVDPVLPRFAADLEWLKTQGHQVERFNLAQQPMKFAENPIVQKRLHDEGTACLPLILVDGALASAADYPTREALAGLLDKSAPQPLPIAGSGGSCCGGSGCC